jgi:DNA-binding HxlR family transcriptional regulator
MVAKQSALKRATEKKHDAGSGVLPESRGAKVKSPASSLDRLIHERLRLGIVSALAANESLTFNDLKSLMNITDGNLSVHARKLEEAGYLTCTKSFEGRLPKTEYKLTAAGRKALENYLGHMETLIQQMRKR